MPKQTATYFKEWRAKRSARRKAHRRPADLPADAECKTCANLPGRRAHSCPATQWLLDEPVCDDCANGYYHRGYKAPEVQANRSPVRLPKRNRFLNTFSVAFIQAIGGWPDSYGE